MFNVQTHSIQKHSKDVQIDVLKTFKRLTVIIIFSWVNNIDIFIIFLLLFFFFFWFSWLRWYWTYLLIKGKSFYRKTSYNYLNKRDNLCPGFHRKTPLSLFGLNETNPYRLFIEKSLKFFWMIETLKFHLIISYDCGQYR